MNRPANEIIHLIEPELEFQAVKSSGPGGQHVNKTNTKVVLRWDIIKSTAVTEEERNRFITKLRRYINKDGVLHLTDQSSKSQLKNKKAVLEKLEQLIARANYKPKSRVKTKPTKSSIIKRLEAKRRIAMKKKDRNKLD